VTTKIFSSKEPDEIDTFTCDFENRLDAETISTATVICEVVQGVDASAAAMCSGDPVIAGSQVRQLVRNGLNGNIYKLTYTAITSGSRELIETLKIPVIDE